MTEFCRKCNGRIAIDVDCPHTAGDRVAAVVDRNGIFVHDDIVTQLRLTPGPSQCWYCGEYGCFNLANRTVVCLCEEPCECDNVCACDCHGWSLIVREAADEIERLREIIAIMNAQPYISLPEAVVLAIQAEEARRVK